MDVLVIGAGGMLGRATAEYLRGEGYRVAGITRSKDIPGVCKLDATDEAALSRFLAQRSFDAVINCAALLVKASGRWHSGAVRLNAWLPHFLEEYCTRKGIYFIHASTDGIFSGLEGGYQENHLSDAEDFYGRSKALGEACGSNSLVVRSGFWGADADPAGQGLFGWFMRQEGVVNGYAHAMFNGVSNLEFARFADAAIRSRWTGVYHLCAAEPISKYEFLLLQKRVFSRPVQLLRDERARIDRTLENTRRDIPYAGKPYGRMMEELRDWMAGKACFSHYLNGEE